MTVEELLAHARIAVGTIGDKPIDDAVSWNHYQLARGVLELFDSARSSAGPINVAAMRAMTAHARATKAEWGPTLEALLEVFDAACAWRDENCSHLSGCDHYSDSHDDACEVTTNMRRLCAAVDNTRGA